MLLVYVALLLTPVLTNEILKFTIEEKSPQNTFIADLSNELQINSSASYSLSEFLPINKYLFTIENQTGYLTVLTNKLDRDDLCLKQHCSCQSCEILFQLIVQSSETIIYKIIQIEIRDRNDHSPIFNNQSMIHVIHIKENVPLGYRIVLPTATDPDEGLNSVQSYYLEGTYSEDFDIDYSSIDIPYLIVRSSLDRQRISSYSLTLIASDHSQQSKPRSSSIQLDIRIVNQSIPTFLQSIYRIDIREDTSIGTSVLKIEAISDRNQEIIYEFLTKSLFVIDHLTGNIQLKKSLDYERQTSYRLIVKAYENSIPSYAIVFIRVIDVNDNPVLIQIKTEGNTTLDHDKNNFYIPEDTPVGTVLGHVILNDLDSSANGNPYLQLTTIHPPLPFIYKLIYQNIFQNTKVYSLILHTKLDRETKSIYDNIQLLAHDSGTPTLNTRLDMLLNITDVNDCIPQIRTNSTIYNINENNPLGLILDTLVAVDNDEGMNGQLEFSIVNQTDLLVINPKSGQLSLNQSIDFEKLNAPKNMTIIDLEFVIQVKDFGQPSLFSQIKLILRIHDLNDHAPQFDPNQSYSWTFSKSVLRRNAILGRIIAHDDDSGLQGIVHFSISSLDKCLVLDITSLGYIYLLSQSSCSFTIYTFEIIASDYGTPNSRSTKQLLFINIDTNDERTTPLPQLIPLSIQRTMVDINSLGNTSFVLDITTNQSILPILILNNKDLSTCWNISSTGEIGLNSRPYALSYILTLNIIDEYTQEISSRKLQIDICNSSVIHSCRWLNSIDSQKENELLYIWAIGLALMITCICVFIFSIMTCLCCRKQKNEKQSSTKQQSFMQFHEDIRSEKTFKTISDSTNRDEDRDSACIINTNSSSLSSGILPIRIDRSKSTNDQSYQPSTYFYDLKLAELIRNNPNPPCVYLNSQSFSSDYGFASSEVSPIPSSCSSIQLNQSNVNSAEWNIEMTVDPSPQKQMNKNTFISTHECVV